MLRSDRNAEDSKDAMLKKASSKPDLLTLEFKEPVPEPLQRAP